MMIEETVEENPQPTPPAEQPLRISIRKLFARLSLRGAFFDYWTYVHAACGASLGLSFLHANLSLWPALLLTAALFTFWEWIEPDLHRLFGFHFPEKLTNQITDVFAGIFGCLSAYTIHRPASVVIPLLDAFDMLAA